MLKFDFRLCLKIVLIHGISAKMPLSVSIFPPAKIISLRNDIMNFKQLDHEHVAQSCERMKLMIRNCPTHGLNLWMIIQKFYAGLNFASRNLLDSAAGGTFMEITLGEATNLLDNIMANYSQWHTERSTSKKCML